MYVIERPSKRLKLSSQSISEGAGHSINDPELPFPKLLYGKEPIENVRLRYSLYKKSVKAQSLTAKRILDETNDHILSNISNIIDLPINHEKLDTVLLLSSTSFSSTSTFTSQLTNHLSNGDINSNNKVIRLNSKECNTIKITLKKIINSLLDDNLAEGNDSDDENDDFSDSESEEEDDIMRHKRLPFDLDSIADWCQHIFLRKNETIESTSLRIVLFLEDTDSFNMGLLNNLIRLVHRFTNRIPFKVIFNVGTSVENFAKKLDTELLYLLDFNTFKIEQTESILNKIVSEIILSDDYLIGNEAMYFLLHRFKNSTRDVNEALKCLKFLKMSFYFSQPFSIISALLQKNQTIFLNGSYYSAIKNTESFRLFINQSLRSNELDSDEILALINDQDDEEFSKLVSKSMKEYFKNLASFRSVFKFITQTLMKHIPVLGTDHLESLAKLTNKDELIRNQFINEILSFLKKIEFGSIQDFLNDINDAAENEDDLLQSLNSKIKVVSGDLTILQTTLEDPESSGIQFKIDYRKYLETLVSIIEDFLKKSFKNPFELLFNEVLQCNDLDILKSAIIPQTRTIIEDSLIDPELYINFKTNNKKEQDPLQKLNSVLNPIASELFQIYRETSLNLNIYDFYQVFKNSLRQDEVMKLIMEILDESDLLESYLNDVDRFKYIYAFFNDVDIPNDQKYDKLMLVLFLQKCGELIDCGFLKQIKRKGDSLEKCIWRGL